MRNVMSWISNLSRKRNQILLYLVVFVALVNPYTLSFLDPNPPLSNTDYFVIAAIHLLNLFAVVLFMLKREVFVQFAIAGIFLILVELGISPFVNPQSEYEFRLQNPEPYLNAEYYSQEFIDESFSQPGRWILDSVYGGVKPDNFVGQWFNVENHRRRTTNTDGPFQNTVYLFGGSTVYNSEVPDALTIASQLAGLGANEASFEVVNMGATSIHSTQQFARLRTEVQLNEGDIVVFYDGVNDVHQRIVYENQEGYMYGDPKNESIFLKALRLAATYSSIAKFLLDTMIDNVRPISISLVDESVSNYVETLRDVKNYVIGQNAIFIHFLQPTLFTKATLNDYETSLIEFGYPFVTKQSKLAFEAAYPKIMERLQAEEYSVSLIDSFDKLDLSPYLDFCHVNHIGNEVIANQIWSEIALRLDSNR